MKPSPKCDFPVNVRRQEWEEIPAVAAHYAGSFDVVLNHTISIMFVPETDRTSWPPSLPENTDLVSSPQEARRVSLARSRYSVTPHARLQGTEETFAAQAPMTWPRVVFYVSPREFEQYRRALARLADERPAVHDARPVSEIAETAVGRFLLSRFAASPHLAPRDRQLLGR